MTLILTLANTSGIFQSSDYQLTDLDTGAPVSDRAGSKQLQASFERLDLRLAFTGVAAIGAGQSRRSTVTWLTEELKGLPHDCTLDRICAALEKSCIAVTRPHGARGVLTVVLTAASVGEPFRVAVISNVDWQRQPPEARPSFRTVVYTITKPFCLISGYRDCVPDVERHRLRALAREIGNPNARVLDELANINAVAAKHGGDYVSEACWVTSQVADGRVRRSTGRNVGQQQGGIPLVMGGIDVSDWVKKNFRPAPRQEIRLVQSAGAAYGPGDGTPIPEPFGEVRRFVLAGSHTAVRLHSTDGANGPLVNLTQLICLLEARCNEEVTVPFAELTFSSVGSPVPDFPRPLLPWPRVMPGLVIDNVPVPRGWEYSIGYWVEDGAHHVVIPQASRSIRGIGFLGVDDELVVVAPSATMEFVWGEHDHAPSATVLARVWWRSRLDGTRG